MSRSETIAARLKLAGRGKDKERPQAGGIEPTDGESRNGWSAQALAEYVTERNLAAGQAILDRKAAPVMRCNSKYNIFAWRRQQR